MKKHTGSRLAGKATPYLFLAPAVLLILFFYAYPLLQSIYISFMDYNVLNPDMSKPAGFSNYAEIFSDRVIPQALFNTVVWVVVSLVLQFLFGFILALLLWRGFRGKKVYQAVVFLPWAVAGFLIGIVFRWMFNAQFGVISDILGKLGLMSSQVSVLSNPNTALVGPITGLVWYGIPFFAIMILAALQSVSTEMLEAAEIDGANAATRLFRVIIPTIKPTIVVTLLLRVIWVFNSADIIYVMTNGGPMNASQTLASYMFQKAYTSMDFSYVSALAILVILFLAAYTIVYLLVTKFEEAGEV